MLTFCKDCMYCRPRANFAVSAARRNDLPYGSTVPAGYFRCYRRPPVFLLRDDGFSVTGFPEVSETDCCGEGATRTIHDVGAVPSLSVADFQARIQRLQALEKSLRALGNPDQCVQATRAQRAWFIRFGLVHALDVLLDGKYMDTDPSEATSLPDVVTAELKATLGRE